MLDMYSVFRLLIKSSITASVLVVIILLVRFIFRKKLGAGWQYCLWLIIVLRLLLPYLPESHFSIYNLFVSPDRNIVLNNNTGYLENNFEELTKEQKVIAKAYLAASNVSAVVTSPGEYLNVLSYRHNAINFSLLGILWFVGFLTFISLTLIANIRFWMKIRNMKYSNDSYINSLVKMCCNKMSVKRYIPAILSPHVSSPAIYGLFKPKILLPSEITSILEENSLKYVVLHELAHYKRKDIAVNILVGLLQALHWFNPLIWYSFYKMKQDREIACDALVLSCIEPEECKQYGETIIDLLKNSIRPIRFSNVIGILNSKSQMKRRIRMISLFNGKSRKWTVMAICLTIILSCAALTNAVATRRIDNINYSFVDDPQVIGKWQSVDFVETMDQFDPSSKKWERELYLNELVFVKQGEMFSLINGGRLAPGPWSWTNGILTHPGDKTASKYLLKEINGSLYMFFEWKSGDYTLFGRDPQYYVLKKIDSNDYSNFIPERKVDDIDLPFIDDPQVIGKWESVDFIKTIDEFLPGQNSWGGDLYLKSMEFAADGAVVGAPWWKWTKGVVIHQGDRTASKYEIREMEGSIYMFMECKNGDYIFRGMEPRYFVLKKVQ